MHIQIVGDTTEATQRLLVVLEFLEISAELTPPNMPIGGRTTAVVLAQPHRLPAIANGLPVVLLDATSDAPVATPTVATLNSPVNRTSIYGVLNTLQACQVPATASGRPNSEQAAALAEIVGDHPALHDLRSAVFAASLPDEPTLILGETGTGKRRVASILHRCSARADKPFIPISCATFPQALLAAELFGCEQGALPGALSRRLGRLEMADGGTLVLEDVEALSIQSQASLLAFMRSSRLERIGSVRSIPCDTRIVTTSSADLAHLVACGEFREDLYYALQSQHLELPPLRDYTAVLPELLSAVSASGCVHHLTDSAWDKLRAHSWPGNLLELRNFAGLLERDGSGGVVDGEELPEFVRRAEPQGLATALPETDSQSSDVPLLPVNGINLKEYLAELERSLITQALEDTGSIVARAADRLHIRRTTLVEKMRKYGLQRS